MHSVYRVALQLSLLALVLAPAAASAGDGDSLTLLKGVMGFGGSLDATAEVGWQYHKLWHKLDLEGVGGTFKPSFSEIVAAAGLALAL